MENILKYKYYKNKYRLDDKQKNSMISPLYTGNAVNVKGNYCMLIKIYN